MKGIFIFIKNYNCFEREKLGVSKLLSDGYSVSGDTIVLCRKEIEMSDEFKITIS